MRIQITECNADPRGISHVRIGAFIQQHRRDVEISIHDRDVQRARTVRSRIVHIRAVRQKYLGRFCLAIPHREQKRRIAAL
ncbi:MAG: hypothetical protein WDO18_04935 [Acidobacteriota bacterium]